MLGRTMESEKLNVVDEQNYRSVSTFEDEEFHGELRWDIRRPSTGHRSASTGTSRPAIPCSTGSSGRWWPDP